MTVNIITLFPKCFESVFSVSILKRAHLEGKVIINFVNPRDFAPGRHKTVDDKPYGGGPGMIMMPEPLIAALESISPKPYAILLATSGKKYNQKLAQKLSYKKNLAIICGHYEGVDARVEKYVQETISIGDFILTGGEIAAMAIVDSIVRLIPGVISKESLKTESFSKDSDYIEYPQYTRPENFRGYKVPKVLLSGNHQKIETWRNLQSHKKRVRVSKTNPG